MSELSLLFASKAILQQTLNKWKKDSSRDGNYYVPDYDCSSEEIIEYEINCLLGQNNFFPYELSVEEIKEIEKVFVGTKLFEKTVEDFFKVKNMCPQVSVSFCDESTYHVFGRRELLEEIFSGNKQVHRTEIGGMVLAQREEVMPVLENFFQ